MRMLLRCLVVAVLLGPSVAAASTADALVEQLSTLAPEADPAVLRMAIDASLCAQRKGMIEKPQRLAVIDYTRPSTEARLWVFDLGEPALLYAEHVAHGRGSGENHATAFSNDEGSYQSSLGLFAAAETYHGENGYSLRLDGLEPGINDRARERAIVIHGAAYVDPAQARRQGRLGRSFGCPAVRTEVAKALIDALRGGQLVYAYHAEPQWQAASALVRCKAKPDSS